MCLLDRANIDDVSLKTFERAVLGGDDVVNEVVQGGGDVENTNMKQMLLRV